MKKYFALLSILLLSSVGLFAQVQEPKQSQIQELSDTIWTHPLLVGKTMAIKFSPDVKYIYTGSAGSDADIITKIDVVTNKVVKVFNTKPNFRLLDLTNGGKNLLIATNNQLSLVNAETGDSIREFVIPKSSAFEAMGIASISISYDNKYASIILYGTDTKQVRSSAILAWELETGKLVANINTSSDEANVLKFSPTENILATGNYKNNGQARINLYEAGTWKFIGTIGSHSASVKGLRFSPDGNYLASWSGTDSNLIKVWDVKNKKLKQNINAVKYLINNVWDACFLNNNSIISSAEILINLDKETKTIIADGGGNIDVSTFNNKMLLIAEYSPGLALFNLDKTLDIKSDSNQPPIILYPNPVTKELNINLQNINNTQITYRVINNIGQEVLHNSSIIQNNMIKINTSNISKGSYILNLQFNNTSKSFNFVVE